MINPDNVYWMARVDNAPQGTGGQTRTVKADRPLQMHKRHTRKYAEGQLGADHSFYFRGPERALNLRAHNLMIFVQMAEGVDDITWEHHLRAGHYSAWFRDIIKDAELAQIAADIEESADLDAAESRKRISEAVNLRYTAPSWHVSNGAPLMPAVFETRLWPLAALGLGLAARGVWGALIEG